MLLIYIKKTKKLQTNIIHAGQDLEPTHMITKKRDKDNKIAKN